MQEHRGLAVPALTGAVFFCSRASETVLHIDRLAASPAGAEILETESAHSAGKTRVAEDGGPTRRDRGPGPIGSGREQRRLVTDARVK